MTTRRHFVQVVPLTACALIAARAAWAQMATPLVDEKSPQAMGLGYVADATRADKAKYPRYAAGQVCATCALFQGKAGDASAGCPLFPGKHVNAEGWCSAWNKKA